MVGCAELGLLQGDQLIGTLLLEEVGMFWTDRRFAPGPGRAALRPPFDTSCDAWERGDAETAPAADGSTDRVAPPGSGAGPWGPAPFPLPVAVGRGGGVRGVPGAGRYEQVVPSFGTLSRSR